MLIPRRAESGRGLVLQEGEEELGGGRGVGGVGLESCMGGNDSSEMLGRVKVMSNHVWVATIHLVVGSLYC